MATLAVFVGRPRKAPATAAETVLPLLLDDDRPATAQEMAGHVVELLFPARLPPASFWPTPLGVIVAEVWDAGPHACSTNDAHEILTISRNTIGSWLRREQLDRAPGSDSPSLLAVLTLMLDQSPDSSGRRV
jgi:hypothetical protein